MAEFTETAPDYGDYTPNWNPEHLSSFATALSLAKLIDLGEIEDCPQPEICGSIFSV